MRVKLTAIKEFLFSNGTLRQTAAKNAFWLAAGNVVGRLIKAGLIIYVARELGAAGYGVFSYAVGLAGFFSLFSDIGVSGILTREGARNPQALPEYLATSLGIKIALLTLANVLLFAVAPHFSGNVPEALPLLPLAALLITADGLRDLITSISRSQEKMQVEAGVSIVTNGAITALGIAAVLWHPTAMALMAGYTLGSLVGTVTAHWALRKHLVRPWQHFRKSLVARIMWEALPFGLLGILGTLMLNTDTLMVGWLTPAADAARALGLYAAAQRPVFVLYIIPTILSTTLFPAFARLASEDKARFRSVLERAVSFCFLVAMPLVVGGLVLSAPLVNLLFGPEYAGATAAFSVLLLTMFTVFPGNVISNAVFAFDAQKTFLWYLALGAGTNALLDYILIPRFGIVGSAWATVIAQVLSNAIIWRKLKSLQEFHVLRFLPRAIGASAVMGVAAWLLNFAGLPVLVSIAFGGIVYAGLLYILKEPLLAYALPSLRRGK